MTKSKGIGRGNGRPKKDKPDNNAGDLKGNPTYYLKKYKSTQRPTPCERCGQNAYYKHPEWGTVCAAHLLDLICIWEAKIDWEEYKEMWDRTERLLNRPAPQRSTTVKNMEQSLETRPAKTNLQSDGSQTQETI